MSSESPRVYQPRVREAAPDTGRRLADELNPEQASAATHGDGPLLIIAGAGTGKTRTLVYRVAHLIDRGVRPERILLLTFTRRAAQEMLARAERLVGSASRGVQGGTFHATAHRLLRKHGAAAGLPSDFTIMDEGDAADLMQLSRAGLGYADRGKRFPRKETLHHVYSRHVNTELPVAEILRDEYGQFREYAPDFARIFADFTERKIAGNLLTFDDLLYLWAELLQDSSEVGERIRALYDHVLVDEYQDTNVLQARILRGLCPRHRNITVVGDDAQSIYSFRGAHFRNILDFPRQWEGATVVTLEQNYRSTQPILDVTNTLISRAHERFTKNLRTERAGGEKPWLVATKDDDAQTQFVASRILELYEEGTPLREIAVLFRSGYLSAKLELELTARKIPFEKWGGIKFLEAAHVKDVVAFLRILANSRDEVSWYRILMLLPGIGDVTARRAIEVMVSASWDQSAFASFVPPARARQAHQSLIRLLHDLSESREQRGAPDAEVARIRRLYDSILRERYDSPDARLADLDQLQAIAAGYPSRDAFLSALALEPPSGTRDFKVEKGDNEDDILVLSTCHSAKGKEWDAVFLIWAVDGVLPSVRSLDRPEQEDEERRLMYVAMTRARNHLCVAYPLSGHASRWSASYSIDQLSRFIDRDVARLMDRVVVAAEGQAAPATEPVAVSTRQDLRAALRARFSGS